MRKNRLTILRLLFFLGMSIVAFVISPWPTIAQGLATPTTMPAILPAALQSLVDTDPPHGDRPRLYQIYSYAAMSLAAADQDLIYSIDQTGATFAWQPDEKQPRPLLQRRFDGLAVGSMGDTVFAWDGSEVFRYALGEEKWLSAGSLPASIQSMVVSADSTTAFANTGDRIWRWQVENPAWLPIEFDPEPGDFELLLDERGILGTAQGSVYGVAQYDVWNGVANVFIDDVVYWDIGSQTWESADWNLEEAQVERWRVSGDGQHVWLVNSNNNLWVDGVRIPVSKDIIQYGITSLLQHDGLWLATPQGLFYTYDGGINWQRLDLPEINAITYHPAWHTILIAANSGVYFLAQPPRPTLTAQPSTTLPSPSPTQTPEPTPTAAPPSIIQTVLDEFKQKLWLGPVTALGGFLATYIIGMLALLILAWRKGSAIVSRSHLLSFAAQPLWVAPGLGRWALFLGYDQRLLKRKSIQKAGGNYFGVPATDSVGAVILPDPNGETLHQYICEQLGPQRLVIIVGMGGAGKSTLLARWVFLALQRGLPESLTGYRPVLITPAYYGGNLIKAIADTLRERDGVAVTVETITAQLQSGRYLILFDGVSEIEHDRPEGLREILRTAQHADYAGCRFLITTRPLTILPPDIPTIHLQPLTPAIALELLPRYHLERERESQARRQLQLFGEKPIAPLLLAMILAQGETTQIRETQAQLYEAYFQRLLGVHPGTLIWAGWRMALEMLAQWLMLDTAKRGLGLPHEPLLERITGSNTEGTKSPNFIERLQKFYQLPIHDALDLLQKLEAAGLLVSGRRWHFAHDTFEEYFAACRLITCCENDQSWPDLTNWQSSPELTAEFCQVFSFVSQMVDEATRKHLLTGNLPDLWLAKLDEHRPNS